MTPARSQRYEFRTHLDAPLAFAFRWCTDYRASDPKLEGEKFRRRILLRTPRRVVYEDLDDTPKGWFWSHNTITLRPPHRWHADMTGSHRAWSLDYSLRALDATSAELTLSGRRTVTSLGGKNPSAAAMQKDLATTWRRLGRALAKDYRARTGRRPR